MLAIYPNQKYIPERAVIMASSKENTVKTEAIIPRGTRYQIHAVGMKGKILTTEIQKGLLLTLSDFTLDKKLEIDEQYSNQEIFQLSFCIEGEFQWFHQNENTIQQYRLGAQECQIRFGALQQCHSTFFGGRKYHSISITLDKSRFEELFHCIYIRQAICILEKNYPVKVYRYTPRINKLLSEIEECVLCEEVRNIYLHGKILELIAILCDEVMCEAAINHYGVRIHEQEYEALLKAKELINQNYAHPLTIAEIAKKAAMSESRLQKGFKQCFGLTVNDYIIKKRMEMAKKLLESGNYSVSAVAWMVGYTHTGYFIRRFHEEYGITPGAIKKINK
ncbi:AraC-like DNA-binding protein [Lachnotalea glycerini]|uniref:AraC-like DNA-binding protein n=1 Tax=Lachnotalea glycerini TaxID=1763509 RepID=A0A318EUH2_9FIRM|nr:AraC family transcriptional regulator [Lachnotalea glycerini]PXV95902.1 AraC-like DNA-binding protein [Lachnotalea glycerini]